MVQEIYGVELSTQERGRLRQEFRAGHHPSAHSAQNG